MDSGRTASRTRTAGLVLVALGWALFLTLIGSPEAVLFTVPVFLLAAPLAFERYVGEEIIARFGTSPRPSRFFALPCPAPTGNLFIGLVGASRISGRGPPLVSS